MLEMPKAARPTVSQRVAIAKALIPRARAEARKRQRFSRRAQFSAGAIDIVAAHVGWSRKTLNKALAVIDAAKRDRRAYGDLVEQMDRSGKVDPAFHEMRRRHDRAGKLPDSQYTPPPGKLGVGAIHTGRAPACKLSR
jgi:hypothetical protein